MKTINTTEHICPNCGTTFAIDEVLEGLRKNDGKPFYCPNGHGMEFSKSRNSLLADTKKELDEAQEEIRNLKTEVTRLRCELVKKDKSLWDRITSK